MSPLTSADRFSQDGEGRTRTYRIPLSRWRHGFEPRWDYGQTRRSGQLTVPPSDLTSSMWAEARDLMCRQDDTLSVSTDTADTPQTTYGSVGFLSYVERGMA